jgi:hypothetical protein
MRIRKVNIRSIKAAAKLPYVINANETRKSLYDQLNLIDDVYDLYEIPKDLYALHYLRSSSLQQSDESQKLEA